jgi:hypothetical protein
MDSSTRSLIEQRLKTYEVGSVQHEHYTQLLKEIDQKVTLHVADEGICESCQ